MKSYLDELHVRVQGWVDVVLQAMERLNSEVISKKCYFHFIS